MEKSRFLPSLENGGRQVCRWGWWGVRGTGTAKHGAGKARGLCAWSSGVLGVIVEYKMRRGLGPVWAMGKRNTWLLSGKHQALQKVFEQVVDTSRAVP